MSEPSVAVHCGFKKDKLLAPLPGANEWSSLAYIA